MLAAAVALARPTRGRVPWVLILLGAAGLVLLGSGVIPAVMVWWLAGAFLAGTVAVAILFALVATPRVSSALLVLAAIFFAVSHVIPSGTAGMAALFLAAVYLEFFAHRTAAAEPVLPVSMPASQ